MLDFGLFALSTACLRLVADVSFKLKVMMTKVEKTQRGFVNKGVYGLGVRVSPLAMFFAEQAEKKTERCWRLHSAAS